MKTLIKIIGLSLLWAILCYPVFSSDEKPRYHNFKVIIKGLNPGKGVVRMALYNKRLFLNKKRVIRANALPVEKDSCVWILNKIDPGEYAIVVYHDINNNKKLDKTFFGKAKEPYAFSGNLKKKKRSAPKFEEVKFKLDENLKILWITLSD